MYGVVDEWLRLAVLNTARSGYFSSDRTIAEYNDAIWHLEPVGVEEDAQSAEGASAERVHGEA